MGSVVGQLGVDARPRGAGVTAAEGDTVDQVTSIHVALDATAQEKIEWIEKMKLHFALISRCWWSINIILVADLKWLTFNKS